MNPRTVAQEAASWYFVHLDPYAPHAENIRRVLRKTVLGLTLKTLSPEQHLEHVVGCPGLDLELSDAPVEEEEEEEQKSTQARGKEWKKYLRQASISTTPESTLWNERDQSRYDSLGHRTKARLDAFLLGCALTLPDDAIYQSNDDLMTLGLDGGLSGFQQNKNTGHTSTTKQKQMKEKPVVSNLLRRIAGSSDATNSAEQPNKKQTQYAVEHDLSTRLELYIRCLVRVRTHNKECVVALEPKKAMKARVVAVVVAFLATVGCVRSMSPVLTRLLECLTKELLAVDTLGPDLVAVIRRVVLNYEQQTSFASLAFLGSPETGAKTKLGPIVDKYMQYVQSNWKNLTAECELERMLSTILDRRMRHSFCTVEFQSIGHLLEVCNGYRSFLHNIQLPPNMGGMNMNSTSCSSNTNTNGTDIDMNNSLVAEVICSDSRAIRQALRDMKRETITVNGHILPAVTSRKELVYLLKEVMNSRTILHQKVKRRKSRKAIRKSKSFSSAMVADREELVAKEGQYRQNGNKDDGMLLSSEYEDTDADFPGNRTGKCKPEGLPERRKVSSRFDMNAVDMLTRRLLVAASRTGMGGDAFFVVNDLFGGEHVDVVPSKEVESTYGRTTKGGIEIVVRLTNVAIKCHGSFDVYPKPLQDHREPLIQVHTTTTEIISLQAVRASDSEKGVVDDSESSDATNGEETSILVLREKQTDKTGWRSLSVRPALYEVVEVWNTPS